MRQYFLSMPKELEEAARIDGAGFFTTFGRVMLPLAGPALAAVSVLAFQGTWNAFVWPLLILRDPAHYTLPLGLVQFQFSGGFGTNWPPLMAAVVLATIPIVILYLFFQRYFVEGIRGHRCQGLRRRSGRPTTTNSRAVALRGPLPRACPGPCGAGRRPLLQLGAAGGTQPRVGRSVSASSTW